MIFEHSKLGGILLSLISHKQFIYLLGLSCYVWYLCIIFIVMGSLKEQKKPVDTVGQNSVL